MLARVSETNKKANNANWDTATCARLPPAGRPLLIMGDMKVES
jgi:hypothetical protein